MVVAEQLVGRGTAPALAVGVVIAIADPPGNTVAPGDTLTNQRAQAARRAIHCQVVLWLLGVPVPPLSS